MASFLRIELPHAQRSGGHLKLSRFIQENSEDILAEWEAFARTVVPLDSMDIAQLRDHAKEILLAIALDLEQPQSVRERWDRSRGLSDVEEGAAETPAQIHGGDRAESGFTLMQMLSEYRALRASVIRLWTEEEGALTTGDIEQLMRFNEAIDQAVAESAARFGEGLEQTRDVFLGILGHDLRTPLGAMITSTQFMLELGTLQPPADTLAARVVSSGQRMTRMIEDLLEFTRAQLGGSLPIVLADVDLREVLEDAVEELRAARPDVSVELHMRGDLNGEWDAARLSQVFSNLLSNAAVHGLGREPITVSAEGHPGKVIADVRSDGPPISSNGLGELPKRVEQSPPVSPDPEHLGLGLYIVQRVVSAHGGTVTLSSDASGNTFTITLPRGPEAREQEARDGEALAAWEDEGGSGRPTRSRSERSPSPATRHREKQRI